MEAEMTEMFQRSSTADSISPPTKGSVYRNAEELPWASAGVEGFWIKPLYENPLSGERTLLMRVGAGAFAPMHSHAEIEQVYVLEGAFYDQNQTIPAGYFVCRAPGEPHTSGSREGALVLLVYSPAEQQSPGPTRHA
jgi:anti-sigma factor ChrR (cupin superfamily)